MDIKKYIHNIMIIRISNLYQISIYYLVKYNKLHEPYAYAIILTLKMSVLESPNILLRILNFTMS